MNMKMRKRTRRNTAERINTTAVLEDGSSEVGHAWLASHHLAAVTVAKTPKVGVTKLPINVVRKTTKRSTNLQ